MKIKLSEFTSFWYSGQPDYSGGYIIHSNLGIGTGYYDKEKDVWTPDVHGLTEGYTVTIIKWTEFPKQDS